MHSLRTFGEILEDTRLATHTVVDALRRGLLELLGATETERSELAAAPMRLPERNHVQFSYAMRPLTIAAIPIGQRTPRIGLRRYEARREPEESGRTREHTVHEFELHDFAGEIPPPLELIVAIPAADPDDPGRHMELTSFEIVSKETNEVLGEGTLTELPIAGSDTEHSVESP